MHEARHELQQLREAHERVLSEVQVQRNRVAKLHERGPPAVFRMVQRFFDEPLVIEVVGCHALNIDALATGKAMEHLALIRLFQMLLSDVDDLYGKYRAHDDHAETEA